MAQSSSTVEQLSSDNKQLAMKLKYLQAVTTIYRQKISSITGTMMVAMPVEARHALSEANRSAEEAVQQFETFEISGNGSLSPTRKLERAYHLYNSPPKLDPSTESEFWRQQFLNLMSEMRPVSVHDANVICESLHNKKNLEEEIRQLKSDASPNKGTTGGGSAEVEGTLNMILVSHHSSPRQRHPSPNNDFLQYPIRDDDDDKKLRDDLIEEKTKNKVLRVRYASLEKTMSLREEQSRADLMELQNENLKIVTSMRDIEEDRRLLRDEVHQQKQTILMLEKTLSLRDAQLYRQQCRTTALEKELNSSVRRMESVFEQENDRRTAEAAAMQQAFDENRRLKTELQLLRANVEACKRQQEDSDCQYSKLKIKHESTLLQNEQLAEKLRIVGETQMMRDWEEGSLLNLLPRFDAAEVSLEKFFTFREVVVRAGSIDDRMDKLRSVMVSLLNLTRSLDTRNNEIGLLRAECDRSVSIGVTPSVTQNVDSKLIHEDPSSRKKHPHIVLRHSDGWMEIRDTGTGSIVFVTKDISSTPFCPQKLKLAEEEERRKVEEDIRKKKMEEEEKEKKAAEDALAQTQRLCRFLHVHDPALLVAVDILKERFLHRFDDLFACLSTKYGAEPPVSSPMPPLPPQVSSPDVVPRDIWRYKRKQLDISQLNFEDTALCTFRDRVARMLEHYNSSRLNTVYLMLANFAGRYDTMMEKLCAKYGPEPAGTSVPVLPPQLSSLPPASSVVSDTSGHLTSEPSERAGVAPAPQKAAPPKTQLTKKLASETSEQKVLAHSEVAGSAPGTQKVAAPTTQPTKKVVSEPPEKTPAHSEVAGAPPPPTTQPKKKVAIPTLSRRPLAAQMLSSPSVSPPRLTTDRSTVDPKDI